MNEQTVEQVATAPASLTAEEVEQFKAKHDCEVVEITIDDKKAWFRSPDLRILDAANAQKKSRDYYGVIAKNCLIAGSTDLVNRDKYFIALMPHLDKVINPFEAQVKNL
jgi:uncharacterized protein (DUF362 family)